MAFQFAFNTLATAGDIADGAGNTNIVRALSAAGMGIAEAADVRRWSCCGTKFGD